MSKPFQEEYDPKDQVTVYHAKVGDEYVIQVSCTLPVVGVQMMRRCVFPLLASSNRAYLDIAIQAEKKMLASDMINKLKSHIR
jgi:hypothetical protein